MISPELAKVLKEMGIKVEEKNVSENKTKSVLDDLGVVARLVTVDMHEVIAVNACMCLDKLIDKLTKCSNKDTLVIDKKELEVIVPIISVFGMLVCGERSTDISQKIKERITNEAFEEVVDQLASLNVLNRIKQEFSPKTESDLKKLAEEHTEEMLIKSYMEVIVNG